MLNGDVSIGRLNGNLLTGVELDDVRIMQAGKPVVLIRNVGLRYNVIDFITTGIVIDSVRITQPRITLVRTRDGWNVASLVKAQRQEADRQGPARTIRIAEIGVSDGAVTIDDQTAGGTSSAVRLPASIDRIDLAGSYAYEPVRMTSGSGTCPSGQAGRTWRSTAFPARSACETTICTSRSWQCGPPRARC